MATTKQYSTVKSLIKYLQILQTIPNKDSTSLEEVGTGNSSNNTFWLNNLGVIEDTYTLYYGSTEAVAKGQPLIETTHYTIDLDTSKITLTTTGVTLVATNIIYASYSYNKEEILNSDAIIALNSAEDKITRISEQIFAEQGSSTPNYKTVSSEPSIVALNVSDKVYETDYSPIIKISTTVATAYTTGATEIVLTSATGLPSSGTIYIGGNKVSYSAKATNTLTIPSTTPSIASGAKVRGEVIEIANYSAGSEPSYTVLDPDTEYDFDYDNGSFKLLSNAYYGDISQIGDELYPSQYQVHVTYMAAWHEMGEDATIPDEIEEITNMIAAKKFQQRIIKKAHVEGMNDFNPTLLNSGDDAIAEALAYYQPLHVGRSMYDKHKLS